MSRSASIRQRLILSQSGMVYIEEIGGGVMLRTVPQTVAHAQALARQYADAPGSSLADFVAERVVETQE